MAASQKMNSPSDPQFPVASLQKIGSGIASISMEDFPGSLVVELSKLAPGEFAFFLQLPTSDSLDASPHLILAERGIIQNIAEFEVHQGAFLATLETGASLVSDGARKTFPSDPLLASLEIESFAGLRLQDAEGEPVALIGVLGRSPLENGEAVEALLQIFGAIGVGQIRGKRAEEALSKAVIHLGKEEGDDGRKIKGFEALESAASGIAHDFNNVLTVVLGNLSLIMTNRDLPPAVTERLVGAKLAGLRGQQLAQLLHSFAKAGSPTKEIFALAELVRESVAAGLDRTAIRTEFEISSELWMAEVDVGQIGQAISNVASYIATALPNGEVLQVRCTNLTAGKDHSAPALRPGAFINLRFHHKGTPIAPGHLKELFDPATKHQVSTTGLAAAASILIGHGGSIEAASDPVEGTTFELLIPAIATPAIPKPAIPEPADPEPVAAPVPHSAGPLRVLILDDEEMLRELLACGLEMLGHEVTHTEEGAATVAAYQRALQDGCRFDLVICDLTIPGGMGGAEAVQRIHAIDPLVKAMVCSGYSTEEVISHFREHGFCGVIPKPYQLDQLGPLISKAMAPNDEIQK